MLSSSPNFIKAISYVAMSTALTLGTLACAGPVAPSALPPAPQAVSGSAFAQESAGLTASRFTTDFPLMNGTFTLSVRTDTGTTGTVRGTYTGTATVGIPGSSKAQLDIHITERTGAGLLVTGIRADGAGAFAGEGAFALSVKLASSVSKIDNAKIMFRGTSQISCSASGLILVTQHSTSSTSSLPGLTLDMQHEVGSTECSS
jgi:hypothetical protein